MVVPPEVTLHLPRGEALVVEIYALGHAPLVVPEVQEAVVFHGTLSARLAFPPLLGGVKVISLASLNYICRSAESAGWGFHFLPP
jgi:hypothetical protein